MSPSSLPRPVSPPPPSIGGISAPLVELLQLSELPLGLARDLPIAGRGIDIEQSTRSKVRSEMGASSAEMKSIPSDPLSLNVEMLSSVLPKSQLDESTSDEPGSSSNWVESNNDPV